jgi:glycosyltransferase involved in cell wall biosynthesis
VRILFVADGRSPIATNWIRYFIQPGYEVHLASTYACEPSLRLASLSFIPVAFSGVKGVSQVSARRGKASNLLWGASSVRGRTLLRQLLGPLTLRSAARRLRTLIDEINPDLVHAMRIPYEGMLTSWAMNTPTKKSSIHVPENGGQRIPLLLISVWGNDFTLHAVSNPWMAQNTRWALQQASALHTDCQRDLRVAHDWGFQTEKPSIVLPGGGGVQLDLFSPQVRKEPGDSHPPRPLTVINPRGFRAYVRNDTFFRAIPIVLARRPEARFVCTGMAGEKRVLGWIQELGIESSVELLPHLSREEMADQFRQAAVTVSPTEHDGTPNTLLEAMACGCFPVAGDLESLREWISPGFNGLLVDPGDPQSLAKAILAALVQPELRDRAATYNLKIIRERAEYGWVMSLAERFYRDLVNGL